MVNSLYSLPAHPSAPQNRLAVLGFGSMTGAIVSGLLSSNRIEFTEITATTHSAASATAATQKLPETVTVSAVADNPAANCDAVSGAATVLLGVKPWAVTNVLSEIADNLAAGCTVISVAAGVTIAAMRRALGERSADVRVIRAMPNTPATIGQGVTGIAAAEDVPQDTIADAVKIFTAVGDTLVVPETQLDALSAVSGSGPAYLFWFAEQLNLASQRLGFTAAEATLLADKTVTGAAALLARGEHTPTELRAAVTSPNGTTERAIAVFDSADPAALFDAALAAAIARAAEIAAANG